MLGTHVGLEGSIYLELAAGSQKSLIHQRTVDKFNYSDFNVRVFLAIMASTAAVIHRLNWVHLDIEEDNILVSSKGILKLCDFDCALKAGHHTPYKVKGAIDNRAPKFEEVTVFDDEGDEVFDVQPEADIYAIGRIAIRLKTLWLPPFQAKDLEGLISCESLR